MSRKASTAALEPSSQRLLRNRRRAPRHPASEKTRSRTQGNNEAMKQESNEAMKSKQISVRHNSPFLRRKS